MGRWFLKSLAGSGACGWPSRKILVQAGVEVGAGTVIVELSNPQLEQQPVDAEFQLQAAQADLDSAGRYPP